MKILVCGGREFDDFILAEKVLNKINNDLPIDLLIQGGQRTWDKLHSKWIGADWLASEWARKYQIPFVNEPALWDAEGKAAGPIRNSRMIEKWEPDVVLALPGGYGTQDMIKKGKRAGLKVIDY
jgi:hypothetical protein